MRNSQIPPQWGGLLSDQDYSALAKSWITPELATAARLRRVESLEGRDLVGQKGSGDFGGIVIPYYWPDEPCHFAYRLRRDHPDLVVDKDGTPKPHRKYLAPPNSANRIYVPPGISSAQLGDPAIPLLIVEGEKKALALWRLANHEMATPRFIPVAIGGVWNWWGRIGKQEGPNGERLDLKGPIPDLSRIAWGQRDVLIVYDSNVHSNENVLRARQGLNKELTSRGASVSFVNLPDDCRVNGIDDLLAAWGPERVLAVIDQRESASDDDSPSRVNQAQRLIQLASEVGFFHTPEGDPYAEVPVSTHFEIWQLRSKGFRRWLIGQFYKAFGKPVGNQALQDAIGVLEAGAHFDSPESALFVRAGEHENRIYIDLGDEQRHVVEIDAHGWRSISDPPVRFRRTKGMRAMPEPVTGGTITMLRQFLNLGSDSNWILCLAWLVAACRPKGPYPMLLLQGEQGSAKSTTAKLLRRLIDPSVAPVRTPPRDDRDLLIAANNSWVISYDNLSGIPPWLSDALCRLATGGGFSTRELYTDSDEVFFDAMRPVILNGIDHLGERADLADRALTLNLPPIDEGNRKDEAQLYAEFERDLPKILGALFTAVSGALANLPQTRLEKKPRMADFALWATAAEQALRFDSGTFMAAYSGNRKEAVQETLEADPVGAAIIALMDSHADQEKAEYWEGTCTELQRTLEALVDDNTRKSRSWPKSPQAMSSRLRRLATFLRESGIHVTLPSKAGKGRRLLTITRTPAETIATLATSEPQRANSSAVQSTGPDDRGGEPSAQVAATSPPALASPPALNPPNALNGNRKETEVAKVAMPSPSILQRQHNSDYGHQAADRGKQVERFEL